MRTRDSAARPLRAWQSRWPRGRPARLATAPGGGVGRGLPAQSHWSRNPCHPDPVCVVCETRSPAADACSGPWQETRKGLLLNTNRPVRRMLLAGSAAGFVIGAVVCATFLLFTDPHGVPRVAAGLLVGLLIVGVAADKYLKRRAASNSPESSRLASPLQASYLPPRQTSDDYWYPAAATRDRAGKSLRGPGRDRDVAHFKTAFESSAPARQARFQREMNRIHRSGRGPQ